MYIDAKMDLNKLLSLMAQSSLKNDMNETPANPSSAKVRDEIVGRTRRPSYSDYLTVTSNWTSANSLKKCSKLLDIRSETMPMVDVEDLVQVENCVELMTPNGEVARDLPLNLDVEIVYDHQGGLLKLSILSEAKNVELFDNGQYFCTIRATKVEDTGDLVMFRAEHQCLHGVKSLSVRLIPCDPDTKTSIYVYAILVEVMRDDNSVINGANSGPSPIIGAPMPDPFMSKSFAFNLMLAGLGASSKQSVQQVNQLNAQISQFSGAKCFAGSETLIQTEGSRTNQLNNDRQSNQDMESASSKTEVVSDASSSLATTTILSAITGLRSYLDTRFERIEEKLDCFSRRLDNIECSGVVPSPQPPVPLTTAVTRTDVVQESVGDNT